ncbi:hypothetical protein ACHWQZ_G011457 [Mnemiopsis leidyi]
MSAMMRRAHGSTSHAQQEKLRAENRRREEFIEDNNRMLKTEAMINANILAEEKVENKILIRRLQREAQEVEMDKALEESKKAKETREQQLEQEEQLAREMALLRTKEMQDKKLRQQIRETSHEIRELEAKLKAGYMNKERAAQLAEKEARRQEENYYEEQLAKTLQDEWNRAQELEREQERLKWESSKMYQQQLEYQLAEQEEAKRKAYEDFLREKLLIDEIVRKIFDEDLRETEDRLKKQKQTQAYIEEFKKAREMWKENERLQLAEENRRILEFAKQQQTRESDRMAVRIAEEEAKAKVRRDLAEKLAKQNQDREELQQIRDELAWEEEEEQNRLREKAERERQIRMRLELQEVERQQIHIKAAKKEAEKQEDDRFRQEMLAKFAEDDRIEQMNAQKRRMKQLEHKRAVEALIEDRRKQFEAEKAAEMDEMEQERQRQAMRQQIIEEERQKLLQEHAKMLLGFMPKGVLRDNKDLSLFDDEFRTNFEPRQVDFFDEKNW